MAYNLLNMAQTTLDKGIVQCFNGESVFFEVCPVQNITGQAIVYNRVNELFTVEKRNLGEDILNIQEMTTEKVTEPLEIFSNSVKVDRAMCLMATDDLRAIETQVQAKSMGRAIHTSILNKIKANAGIKITMPDGQSTDAESVSTAMDGMPGGDANKLIFANPKTLRELKLQAVASGFTDGHIELFGKNLQMFNGVGCQPVKDMPLDEILIVYFDVAEGVALATNGGIKSYDQGLKGIFYVTDMEILCQPIIKNTKAVALVTKPPKTKKK